MCDQPETAPSGISAAPPGPPSGLQQMLQDSTLYLIGNVASRLVGFAMIPFYARLLSAEEYGVLNLLELATTIVALTFGLQSLGQSMTRVHADQGDRDGRLTTVSTALIGTVALAGSVAVLAAVFASPISVAVSLPGQAALLRMAFLAMFFSSIGEVALVYQRMRNRARFYLVYSMVTLVGTVSLNMVFIGGLRLGVWGFVVSKLLVTGAGTLFLLARTLREVGVAWSGGMARALAKFGAPLIVSGGSYFAIHFSDRLFLAHVSRAEVGVYSLAYNFAFLLSILVGDSFNKSWNVSLYGLASGTGWQLRFVQVGRWLIFVLGTGSVGISLFGRDLLTVMVPSSYYPPLLMLPVLVFAYFLREVGDFFNSMLLIGIGSGLVGRIAMGAAALNLVLNALLIAPLGIWGAAWATLATWSVYCAVCWMFAWRVHAVAMRPWPLAGMLGLSVACLWARWAAAPDPALARLSLDGGLFAVFLGSAVLLYLHRSERREAWRIVVRAAYTAGAGLGSLLGQHERAANLLK